MNTLLARDHEYQELWNSDKESVKQDEPLMKDWLHVIKDIESYGKKSNQSMITCLVKCINET
ncbi:hypothetical protein [Litorilituus lipolyticus]|uniref:Uncharacterized protein n=1 Tax=Litorilituus lipolyticus TaxID=2491017 RepID=A0A502KS45_9GAMM|nr:hypothetical protein [Litorilituus lipolyticus]TPH14530.1 hypothetical protein EPA86_11520 [Litorilituus lipolyticus]